MDYSFFYSMYLVNFPHVVLKCDKVYIVKPINNMFID